MKIRVTSAGGASLDLEVENRTSVKEIFDGLKDLGFTLDGDVSINGESVDYDAEPEDGDVVSAHKSPEGN